LLNAGGATNIYDAMNNRIGQAQGTNVATFVVNPNNKLPQVLMRVKNGVTNYYIYGSGLLYQITETATFTNTRTYHYDYRGSAIALSADSGLVTDRIEYSAYGLTTYRIGGTDTPFLFNGRYGVQTDGNGLLYMRARHYNPYLCRFISADPSGFSGGLNHYAYANGNPVSYLDPFGLTNWKQVGEGALELTGAGIATAGIILTEAPSFGTSTLLISGVTLGITKGEADLAAGFADVPPSSPVGEGVNSIPSNLGALVASPFGQDAQDTAGLAFDIATLRFSSGPDFFESLSSGNNLLLNTTAFGVDATSVGLGVYNMTYGTEGAGNQIVSPLQNQSFWNYSLTINPSGSSTGK
jgi:RHS repeat-associated protein